MKKMLARLRRRPKAADDQDSSSETDVQRRERWCRLRDHLRDRGLKDVPDDCLEEPKPEWRTRPGVPLVAYFPCVKQEAIGQAAKFSTLPLIVALFALLLALLAGIQAVQTAQCCDSPSKLDNIASYALAVVAVVLAIGFIRSARKLESVEAPFYLDLEELSLVLPTGSRHAPWADVYSVASDPEMPDRLRVELQDGMRVLVSLEAPDREPLEKLMVELILRHR